MRYLQRNNVAFTEPDVCPPNSPDLNPVNYAVGGGALQQLVYQHRSFTSVAELKQAIINTWQELSARSRLLTEALTNGVVALSAWYIRMGAISNTCLNK